jgi:hypothetical protein
MGITWQVSPIGLEIEFFKDVDNLLRNSHFDWTVTCGFRSRAASDILYAAYLKGGPRAAPGGKSPHNIGEAIDVVPDGSIKPGLQMDWDTGHESWQWLFMAIKAHPRLHSGLSFSDAPHIESIKFTRDKKRHEDGTYYIPVQNLHYLNEVPSNIKLV